MIMGALASVLLAGWISLLPSQATPAALPPRASSAAAKAPLPVPAKTPAVRARAHGIPLSGRVSGLDPAKKTFSVRDPAGRETSLVYTGATKVSGGALKVGESVTLRYLDKDTRHIATTIRISVPSPPAAGSSGASSGAAPPPSPPPS
ncbi:MAG: hypothetical protein LC796_12415 [Acidobacteria bacterium]|nr:hypothetical protein [Acidobacteriota bacterium]MCA1609897.1 hypothetical protein [Acidobacteriota bacterium]